MDEQVMLVKYDAKANNAKFYELVLSGDTVHARYGRVGTDGQKMTYGGGARTFESKRREKERKGYKKVGIATSDTGSDTDRLRSAARTSLAPTCADNADVATLIDLLVAKNAHDILSTSGGRITVADGQVRTPLGLLTHETIGKARIVLSDLQKERIGSPDRTRRLEEYLSLVPQKVGSRRGWQETTLVNDADLDAQRTFLAQLEASLDVAVRQSRAADEATDDKSLTDLFQYRIEPVTDEKVIAAVRERFKKTRSMSHAKHVTGATLTHVYDLTATMTVEKTFADELARLGNPKDVYHASRAHNVLSILSNGLLLPTQLRTAQTTGAMYGHGIYGSVNSTKALGYGTGGVWSTGIDRTCFMFEAVMVMGHAYEAGRSTPDVGYDGYDDVLEGRVSDPKGCVYDSINVEPGSDRVRNHEAIVPGPHRIALRRLLQFETP